MSFTFNDTCNINSINTANVPNGFVNNIDFTWCGFQLPDAEYGNTGGLTVNSSYCCKPNTTVVYEGCFTYCEIVDGIAPFSFQSCVQNQARRSDGVPVGNVSTLCTQKVLNDVQNSGNNTNGVEHLKAGWTAALIVGLLAGAMAVC
ncbi:hypothetical protein PRZ48_015197 [Zasmidium cellare]|uniref:Uncharacterized protein n=1 Tax=Zasmidium cellare TaxID=395010 RepID=A0ABR0DXW6_ZASCE|nr:hypothetical protein PRZ48_015197 [Zasmidium cellare]